MPPRKNSVRPLWRPRRFVTHQTTNVDKKSRPNTLPRPRVICPSCHTEFVFYKIPADSAQAIHATTSDMTKLGIECENKACVLYMEGIENVDEQLYVNPVIAECIEGAKNERAAFDTAEEEKRREEEAVEYSKYDPFRGYPEEAEALEKEKQQNVEREAIVKNWEMMVKYTEEMDKLDRLQQMDQSNPFPEG